MTRKNRIESPPIGTQWITVDFDVTTPGVLIITKKMPTEGGMLYLTIFQRLPNEEYVINQTLVPYDPELIVEYDDDVH